MSENKAKSANSSVWFKSFMIFLLVIIIALSLGLTIFYFMSEDENLYLDKTLINTNLNEEFSISIVHDNPDGNTKYELNYDSNVLQLVSKSENNMDYTFKTIASKQTEIVLSTNNTRFGNLSCVVTVADGTVSKPFLIRNAQELSEIGTVSSRPLSAHYKQVNDIDLSKISNWTPIASSVSNPFTGTYDGNYKTIYNLTINNSTTSNYSGLFGYVGTGASVYKLYLKDVNITSSAHYVGSVAGYCNGNIERVEVVDAIINQTTTDTVSSDGTGLGGIVGAISRNSANTKLNRVSFFGTLRKTGSVIGLTDHSNIGGLVGKNSGATIYNSYAIVNIYSNGDNSYAGGLVGYNRYTTETRDSVEKYTTNLKGNIMNCYAVIQDISTTGSSSSNGAIVGYNLNCDGTNEFINSETNNVNRFVGVYYLYDNEHTLPWMPNGTDTENAYLINGVSLSELKQQSTFKTYSVNSVNDVKTDSWNFVKVWAISADVNNGLPVLRVDGADTSETVYDPYASFIDETINTADKLNNIRNDLEGIYKITADIDLTGYSWEPIGTLENPFNGTVVVLDEYKITGLNVTGDYQYAGLFGVIGPDAKITNMKISGTIRTGTYNGVIAGINEGVISDCNVLSTSSITAGTYSGMLVGSNTGYIENSITEGSLSITSGTNECIGGLVGENFGTLVSSQSKALMTLSSTDANSEWYVGGISGQNYGQILEAERYDNVTIQVTGNTNRIYAGGISGYNLGKVTNSVASAIKIQVPKTNSNNYAGGIVGFNYGEAIIELCEVINGTIESYWTGGLAGYNLGTANGTIGISRSMVNSTITLFGNEIGGLVGRMQLGTMQNCATFASLSGNNMSGYASTIEGSTNISGDGNYATVKNCFSAVIYDASAGKRYTETRSEVRASNVAILFSSDKGKIAGYVINCIYNSDRSSGAEKKYNSYRIGSVSIKNEDDGARNSSQCKEPSTFTNRGFSTEFWSFVSGSYPTIKGL